MTGHEGIYDDLANVVLTDVVDDCIDDGLDDLRAGPFLNRDDEVLIASAIEEKPALDFVARNTVVQGDCCYPALVFDKSGSSKPIYQTESLF